MRLNPLPPTLRDNQRYIVFEIISKEDIAFENLVNAVWNTSLQLFGDVGTSKFKMWVPSTFFDKSRKKGIVRTTHNSVEEVRAVLASIRQIEGVNVIMYVLGVTGTIKSARTKFLGLMNLRDFEIDEKS
ncbi:MAG: Rpp14/Pop5 family protein [archaeon]